MKVEERRKEGEERRGEERRGEERTIEWNRTKHSNVRSTWDYQPLSQKSSATWALCWDSGTSLDGWSSEQQWEISTYNKRSANVRKLPREKKKKNSHPGDRQRIHLILENKRVSTGFMAQTLPLFSTETDCILVTDKEIFQNKAKVNKYHEKDIRNVKNNHRVVSKKFGSCSIFDILQSSIDVDQYINNDA
ncbi:jg18725 [Pararge aegeria aegeria]|uniref:Jg18725 protein n=1 Tax=Pararge aegeria aegeria TaxID=348720 RepID=A0A8S4RNR7_9NEOP|nr:jg18725 [Pararge aegeria aegeria]